MSNAENVDYTPEPDDEQDPTSDEIQAVVDTIDLLIAAEETPPYDVDSLPKTKEELIEQMVRDGKTIGGMYPHDVPTIPLIPVDNLVKFGIKRYPRESAAHHSGIAQVQREWPLPDLGPNATKFEVIHISETPKGLKVHREFAEHHNDGRTISARDFFWAYDMHQKMGNQRVSSSELAKVKRQLSASRIMS
jgi:hypothetical protein